MRSVEKLAAVFGALILGEHIVSSALISHGNFTSIGCKTEPTDCAKYSTIFGQYYEIEEEVVVPCDTCLTMIEFRSGEVLNLTGGVNVQGLLYFPPDVNVTINLPHLVVEGKLIMETNEVVDFYPEITINMVGDTDLHFVPNATINSAACEDPSGVENFCDFGKKGIVVAGGSVDIRGLPDTCPTWSNLLDVVTMEEKNITNYTKPADLPLNCTSRTILSEDFTDPTSWEGSAGSSSVLETSSSHDGSQFMKVTERSRSWQGPYVEIDETLSKCFIPDEEYLFRAKIKFVSNNDLPSACSTNGTDCMELRYHSHFGSGALSWKTLHRMPPVTAVPDGEWFDYIGSFSFEEEDTDTFNFYNMLSFAGPEGGIDISIDDILIEMPKIAAYPDPTKGICKQMVINGDASLDPYHPFPMTIFGRSSVSLSIEHNSTDGNPYFKLSGRVKDWNSMEVPFPNDCIEEWSVYHFTAKVWSQAENSTNVRMTLQSELTDGSLKTQSIGSCPPTNKEGGWVECSRYFMFEDEHFNATSLKFFFVTEDDTSDIWYDDIEFNFHAAPVNQLILPSAVAECWGPGAEIMITSHTMELEDTRVRGITNVTVDGEYAIVSLNETMRKHTTVVDSPDFAVEVALLSRNIRFTSEKEDDPYNDKHGGHFLIARTPNVKQHIQGVEFLRFGQMGNLGRYPIHYHVSDNNPDSYIGKNTIRDSFQRCIVLHATHNVTVTENIAYDTFGHCFMVEDGFEQDNTFYRNVGALTKITPDIGILGLAESDMFASTFWISNPKNHFIDNVCAGSEDTGFWYEFLEVLRGESINYDPFFEMNPSSFLFGSFNGNVMHSNQGDGFKLYPNGYFPETEAVFYNTRSFRNKGDGVLLHNSAKLAIDGGIYADNRVQVEVDKQADAVRVSNAKMLGLSPLFKYEVEAKTKAKSHCPATRALVGVQLHSFLRYRDSDGYLLENLSFEGFGETLTDCVGSTAIQLDPQVRDGHYDAYAVFKNMTFEEGSTMEERFNICDLAANGIKDLAINDLSGDLNPLEVGVPGWIVSDDPTMTAFIDSECHTMEGSCSLFCPDASICYRALNFATSQAQEYEDMAIEVTADTGEKQLFYGYFAISTKTITGNVEVIDHYDNFMFQRRRYFTPILPTGNKKYTMQFVKNGEPTWPTFVETVWEKPPNCTGYIENEHVNLITTPPREDECQQVIKHHDLEEGTKNHWIHSGGDIKIVSPGHNSSYAISSVLRTGTWQGPAQFLDSRCMKEGQAYEISVKYRLHFNGTFVACDPSSNEYMGDDVCPRVSFRLRHIYDDVIGSEVNNTYLFPMALPVLPVSADGWNLLTGVFTVTQEIATATTVLFFVERGRSGQNIILDDVKMTKTVVKCDDVSLNRGLETGDSRYWFTHGHVKLQMVSPGADDSMHAIATVYRDSYWASMAYMVDTGCLLSGNKYLVTVQMKLVDGNGNPYACDPAKVWGEGGVVEGVCPIMSLKADIGGAVSIVDIGGVVGNWAQGEWNTLIGVLTASEDILEAESVAIFFQKVVKEVNIIVDSMTIETAENINCENLIENGNGEEGDARFWKIHGKALLTVQPGGATANSLHTLVISNRAGTEDGLRQDINKECLEPGLYEVSAKIKMVDIDEISPVSCNIHATSDAIRPGESRSERCPLISIGSRTQQGPQLRYVASAKEDWVADGWNLLQGKFAFFYSETEAKELMLIINKAPQDVIMYVDDVKLTKLSLLSSNDLSPVFGTEELPTRSPITDTASNYRHLTDSITNDFAMFNQEHSFSGL